MRQVTMSERETWSHNTLHELLNATDLNDYTLADEMGISYSVLRNYADGETVPPLHVMMQMADYFGVPLDFLTGRLDRKQSEAILKNYPQTFNALRRFAFEDNLRARRSKQGSELSDPNVYDYERPWPYNLFEAVAGECLMNTFLEETGAYVLTEDQENGINYAVSQLRPSEQEAIKLYFQDMQSLAEIGRAKGFTTERARQIVSKSLKKLRSPQLFQYFRYGLEKSSLKTREENLDFLEHALDSKEAALNERKTKLKTIEDCLNNIEGSIKGALKTTREPILAAERIENMHLSPRTFNCLRREGIRNIQDLEGVTEEDLARMRGMGRKSVDELIAKLEEYGVILPHSR